MWVSRVRIIKTTKGINEPAKNTKNIYILLTQ